MRNAHSSPDVSVSKPGRCLSLADFFRHDIREGQAGTLLTLTLKVVNVNANGTGVANANVEIWHADASGNYSQYGNQSGHTYLRGFQTTDARGEVTFTTIYPGWYQCHATHIHAEVSMGARSIKVTQLAFPESASKAVYMQGPYAGRGPNPVGNASDGFFRDAPLLVALTGNPVTGFSATARIEIAIQKTVKSEKYKPEIRRTS